MIRLPRGVVFLLAGVSALCLKRYSMSTRTFEEVSRLLHDVSPYEGFDTSAYELDVSGFAQNKALLQGFAEEVHPRLMIEVGSWKGLSSSWLGEVAAKQEHPCGLICVDTWLGAREFWASGEEKDGWWQGLVPSEHFRQADQHYRALGLKHGYPTVYYQFLANMALLGLQNHVTPFPQTSVIAARWFASHQIQADFVFIDGSHDYDDVVSDACLYWPLVAPGGLMCGDDYWIEEVKRAIDMFAGKMRLKVEYQYPYWIIRKPR